MIAFIAAVGYILYNVMSNIGSSYQMMDDRIIVTTKKLSVEKKEISWQNVVSISYDKKGFFNSLFNMGSVNLDLTGMQEKSVKLTNVPNIEQNVQFIQTFLIKFKNQQQANYVRNYGIEQGINNVMNKY